MQIKSAEFKQSSPRADMCPDSGLTEYAFIGRSNVGKSSLINMLCERKKLAMTSSTPGKTLLINHFLISSVFTNKCDAKEKQWFLVDLPGYGYAQRGKREMAKLENLISHYIIDRKQLTCLFVLLDIRLKPQQIDLEFLEWLGENEIPFAIVFTKADKVKEGEKKHNIQVYLNTLKERWEELPTYFITSSEKRIGREDVLEFMETFL